MLNKITPKVDFRVIATDRTFFHIYLKRFCLSCISVSITILEIFFLILKLPFVIAKFTFAKLDINSSFFHGLYRLYLLLISLILSLTFNKVVHFLNNVGCF